MIIDLDTMQARRVLRESYAGWLFPFVSPSGHIIYRRRSGGLMAAGFDLDTLKPVDEPAQVLDAEVLFEPHATAPVMAANGTMVYGRITKERRSIAIVDRKGETRPWATEQPEIAGQCLDITSVSWDGSTFACASEDPDTLDREVWTGTVAGGALQRVGRVTMENCREGVFSPDGSLMAATCTPDIGPRAEDGLYIFATDGTGARLHLAKTNPRYRFLTSAVFSPDAKWAGFTGITSDGGEFEYMWASVDPQLRRDPELRPMQEMEGTVVTSVPPLPPGGRWISYSRLHRGGQAVFIRALHEDLSLGDEIQVTDSGSGKHLWARTDASGRQELIFNATGEKKWEGRWMGRWVDPDTGPESEAPHHVVDYPYQRRFVALPDGRFITVVNEPEEEGSKPDSMEVVLNWTQLLERQLAGPVH